MHGAGQERRVTPHLLRIGAGAHPVVVVDTATGAPDAAVAIAAALAPFPRGPNPNYPGVRRVIEEADAAAFDYVTGLLEALAPFIAGGFDCGGFDLLEASFSIVTTPPAVLRPGQRMPHFDSTDPRYLAVMHYLGDVAGSGTAFYHQRSTAIEVVTDDNAAAFLADAQRHAAAFEGYVSGSNAAFEEIGRVDGNRDRVVIYQGALLHSGIIPATMPLDPDPRRGRLTTNIFVRTR